MCQILSKPSPKIYLSHLKLNSVRERTYLVLKYPIPIIEKPFSQNISCLFFCLLLQGRSKEIFKQNTLHSTEICTFKSSESHNFLGPAERNSPRQTFLEKVAKTNNTNEESSPVLHQAAAGSGSRIHPKMFPINFKLNHRIWKDSK